MRPAHRTDPCTLTDLPFRRSTFTRHNDFRVVPLARQRFSGQISFGIECTFKLALPSSAKACASAPRVCNTTQRVAVPTASPSTAAYFRLYGGPSVPRPRFAALRVAGGAFACAAAFHFFLVAQDPLCAQCVDSTTESSSSFSPCASFPPARSNCLDRGQRHSPVQTALNETSHTTVHTLPVHLSTSSPRPRRATKDATLRVRKRSHPPARSCLAASLYALPPCWPYPPSTPPISSESPAAHEHVAAPREKARDIDLCIGGRGGGVKAG
ncbi:hypothetical protein B0H14DRAFT_3667709 [Mycena olivaceomarginata]|nr:hypothetical protein B0H14DRAFT_3667709 [Mycena olivaceomarginata]